MKEILENFFKKIWFFFPFVFYAILAENLLRTHGQLRLLHLVLLSFGFFLFLLWSLKGPPKETLKLKEKENGNNCLFEKALAFLWCFFSLFLSLKSELIHTIPSLYTLLIKVFLILNFLSSLCFFIFFKKYPQFFKKCCLLSLALLSFVLILVPFASPTPNIDVWAYAQIASKLLLEGKNPYASFDAYPDWNAGIYGPVVTFPYWPVPTYFYTLGYFFFKEVRGALILCQFVTVFGIWKICKKSFGENTFLSLLFPLVWACFPVIFFVLEQSWSEGSLLPFLVFFFYFLKQKKWKSAAFFLGLMAMNKQYMIFSVILSFIYVWREADRNTNIQFFFIFLITCFLLALPFLVWDFQSFYRATILWPLNLYPRDDGLSWYSYALKNYKYILSAKFIIPLYLGVLIFVCIGLMKRWFTRTGAGVGELLTSFIILYLVVFLFGKQAFCNYYYMVALMLLLVLSSFTQAIKGQSCSQDLKKF